MDIIVVVILSIGLAMDAFAVSVCKGLAMKKPTIRSMAIIGLWFGAFQALMPLLGFYIGRNVHGYIESIDHWIAFILLLLIGLNMIREALSDEEEGIDDSIGFKIMLLLAIATSIDAFAVGISLAMDSEAIFIPVVLIGSITFAISAIGVKLGSIVGNRFSTKAELIGGAILILIGVKILVEHLGLL